MKTGRQIHRHSGLLIGVNEHPNSFFDSIPQTTYDVVKLESVLTAYDYEVRMFHSCQLDPERKPTIDAKLQDKPCIFFM